MTSNLWDQDLLPEFNHISHFHFTALWKSTFLKVWDDRNEQTRSTQCDTSEASVCSYLSKIYQNKRGEGVFVVFILLEIIEKDLFIVQEQEI